MKKFLLSALSAVALMAGLSACSSEEPLPIQNSGSKSEVPSMGAEELTTVSFIGNTPKGIHSRGYESSISRLIAAVYDTNGNLLLSEEYTGTKLSSILSNGKFNVQFNLATQGAYRVFFWADRPLDLECDVDLKNHTIQFDNIYNTVITDVIDDADYIFMYDEPVVIKPVEQSEFNITLRRPLANVVLVSNQIKDPTISALFEGYDAITIFGTACSTNTWTRMLNDCYNFWTGEASPKQHSSINWLNWNYNPESWNPVVEGFTTMYNQLFFVNRDGSTMDCSFFIDEDGADCGAGDAGMEQGGGGRQKITIPVGERTYKQNCRYIFKDDKNVGGGMFGSETSFSVTVDSIWDDTSVNNL